MSIDALWTFPVSRDEVRDRFLATSSATDPRVLSCGDDGILGDVGL